MKLKRFLTLIFILIMMLSLFSCEKNSDNSKDKGETSKQEEQEVLVNILEQPDDYVGKFKVPESKDVEKGSALSAITDINENMHEINTAQKTGSDDVNMLESYMIDCYDINIEIFKLTPDHPWIAQARDSGKISFYSAQGKLLAEKRAASNGNYVIMFGSDTDINGNDCSKKNDEMIEYFKSLNLK